METRAQTTKNCTSSILLRDWGSSTKRARHRHDAISEVCCVRRYPAHFIRDGTHRMLRGHLCNTPVGASCTRSATTQATRASCSVDAAMRRNLSSYYHWVLLTSMPHAHVTHAGGLAMSAVTWQRAGTASGECRLVSTPKLG